jgi:hypothetical protein
MKKPVTALRKCSRGHEYEKSKDLPVCPICWSGYYRRKSGSDLPESLSAPALRALLDIDVKTLAQLSKMTEKEVAELHGMGPSGVKMLKSALKKAKLSFKKKEK